MSTELALIQQVRNKIGRAPKTIVNYFSTSGQEPILLNSLLDGFVGFANVSKSLSGVTVANTLKTLLDITGSGSLDFCAVTSADTTSRVMRIKITLDAVVIFDSTLAACTVANSGMVATGISTGPIGLDPLPFNTSCLVEFSSSLSESNRMNTYYSCKTY